ncbi:MAG TPA: hypothetical protein PK563_16065 [Tenuifilaceae bacterium]|nr:hypothetical protein [Tenuifilaceae bacterium]
MNSKKTKINKLKSLLSGTPEGVELPLFWEFENGYYVSGNFKLTPEQFEKLKKKNPLYVGWHEEKTY